MGNVVIHNHSFKIKISSAEIQSAVTELAKTINHDLKGKNPLFLAVLNGSFIFAADLIKQLTIDCEISFVKLASYDGTSSTGKVKQLIGIDEEIKGRTVVVIEDIVDTGNTIESVWEQLKKLAPAEIKIATLLFKSDAFLKSVPIEYAAIIVPSDFLVGYGLDYKGLGRNLNDIYVLDYVEDEKRSKK